MLTVEDDGHGLTGRVRGLGLVARAGASSGGTGVKSAGGRNYHCVMLPLAS
jgi:hypothetical protein